jgi:hypothetical protein
LNPRSFYETSPATVRNRGIHLELDRGQQAYRERERERERENMGGKIEAVDLEIQTVGLSGCFLWKNEGELV